MAVMDLLAAKSVEASQLRRRKYELVRRFALPENLMGGSLSETHRRCGRQNCRCATGRGHALWSVTFSRKGKRRVEWVPKEWVQEVAQVVAETSVYIEAAREVMDINLELLTQCRRQQREKKVRARGKIVTSR